MSIVAQLINERSRLQVAMGEIERRIAALDELIPHFESLDQHRPVKATDKKKSPESRLGHSFWPLLFDKAKENGVDMADTMAIRQFVFAYQGWATDDKIKKQRFYAAIKGYRGNKKKKK